MPEERNKTSNPGWTKEQAIKVIYSTCSSYITLDEIKTYFEKFENGKIINFQTIRNAVKELIYDENGNLKPERSKKNDNPLRTESPAKPWGNIPFPPKSRNKTNEGR